MNNIEAFHKQIDLHQDCIKRMANNSFLIKGWAIGLLSIMTFMLQNKEAQCLFLVLLPLLSFWYLDGYYVTLERAYRAKYSQLVLEAHFDKKFYILDLSNPFGTWGVTVIKTMWHSISLRYFYGVLLLISVLLNIFLRHGWGLGL